MVERANRTIEMLLATTVAKDQRDWDRRLPYVMAAYRSSAHSTTNLSPNLMMLGRESTTPLALSYPPQPPPGDALGYAAELRVSMARAFEHARNAVGKAVQRQRRNYDARAVEADIEVGETVFYFHPIRKKGISPKLQSYWTGPWTVTARIGAAVYEIRRDRSRRIVHYDAIKRAPLTGEEEEAERGEPRGNLPTPDTGPLWLRTVWVKRRGSAAPLREGRRRPGDPAVQGGKP